MFCTSNNRRLESAFEMSPGSLSHANLDPRLSLFAMSSAPAKKICGGCQICVTFHGKMYTNGFPLNGQNERLPNGSQTGHQAV